MESTLMECGSRSGTVRRQMSTRSGPPGPTPELAAHTLPGRTTAVAWTSWTSEPVAGFKYGTVSSVLKPLMFVSSLTPVTQSSAESRHVLFHHFSAVRD